MKISLKTIILLLISLSYGFADEQKASTLMWEIRNADQPGRVFVLGSIHLADSSLYPLNKSIESAFEMADALVLEIIIDEVNPMAMMQYLTYKDGRTLESELEPDVYELIASKFEQEGIPKYIYNKFKPWFAVLTLQSGAFKGSGFTAGEGIDMYFLNKARISDKEVMEIESLESQISLLDELGDYTGDYLKAVLQETDSVDNSMELMLQAWKNGDDKAIESIAQKGNDQDEYNEVMEKLNYKRNEKMVDKIKEYLMNDKTYFVVVGAAHVVGTRGIIELIKKSSDKFTTKRY